MTKFSTLVATFCTILITTACNSSHSSGLSANEDSGVKSSAELKYWLTTSEVDTYLTKNLNALQEAIMIPKYDKGPMIGFVWSDIKEGSFAKRIGLVDGDILTELSITSKPALSKDDRLTKTIRKTFRDPRTFIDFFSAFKLSKHSPEAAIGKIDLQIIRDGKNQTLSILVIEDGFLPKTVGNNDH